MRLNVGEFGGKQFFRPLPRQVLDHIHVLTAAIISPAWISLSILVRQHTPDRLHHGRTGIVLAGDHFQAVLLTLFFANNGGPDFRILCFNEIHLRWLMQINRPRHNANQPQATACGIGGSRRGANRLFASRALLGTPGYSSIRVGVGEDRSGCGRGVGGSFGVGPGRN